MKELSLADEKVNTSWLKRKLYPADGEVTDRVDKERIIDC